MNIFERASRKKLRLESPIGDLTVEQLWDLPLKGGRADLDSLARNVNGRLKALVEESFVEVNVDPYKTELQLKLDIIKHVIAAKQAAAARFEVTAAAAERRRKLLAVLEAKEEAELTALTKEEILEQLGEAKVPEDAGD